MRNSVSQVESVIQLQGMEGGGSSSEGYVSDKCDDRDEDGIPYSSYVGTPHGAYRPDKPDSPLVQAAAAGDLARVQLVETGCREKGERGGKKDRYDRSWEWNGDTALIAAARNAHSDVVRYLLADALADTSPGLESMHHNDITHTPCYTTGMHRMSYCNVRFGSVSESTLEEIRNEIF